MSRSQDLSAPHGFSVHWAGAKVNKCTALSPGVESVSQSLRDSAHLRSVHIITYSSDVRHFHLEAYQSSKRGYAVPRVGFDRGNYGVSMER